MSEENEKIAEEISCKTKLSEAEGVIEAWNKVFGTTQLSHAIARLEAAEARVKKLERELEPLVKERITIEKMDEDIKETIHNLESHLAQELERGKLKDAVVEAVKFYIDAIQSDSVPIDSIEAYKELREALTALNESEKEKP